MRIIAGALLSLTLTWAAHSQTINVTERLKGFDEYMAKTLKDWNAPGVGVGIVVNDKLVFAKGYGYRDYCQFSYIVRLCENLITETGVFPIS